MKMHGEIVRIVRKSRAVPLLSRTYSICFPEVDMDKFIFQFYLEMEIRET
jgi:hypothetical protein